MSSGWTLVGDLVRLLDETDTVRVGPGSASLSPPPKLEVVGNALVTLQDKGGNVFDVKAYGAKGDGSTNDWSKINDAVTALVAAGGGTLYFPRGTYVIDQPIVINNTPFLMRGAGPEASTIKMIGIPPGRNPASDFIKTNFGIATPNPTGDREMYMEIRDLKFVADGTPTAGAAILQRATPDPTFALLWQNTFVVRNCWFYNVWDAIHLTNSGSAIIKDCQILSPLHAAIFLESEYNDANGGSDVGTTFICDNYIWDRIPTLGDHPQPIHGVLATTGVPGLRIHHNSFLNFDRPIYIDLTQPGKQSRVHIDHNSIDGFSKEAKIRLRNHGGLDILDVSSNDITIASPTGIGIQVDLSQASGLLSTAVITGNTFNNQASSLDSRRGIVLNPTLPATAQRIRIDNNIFTNLQTGIEIGAQCNRVYIGDNAFEYVGTPPGTPLSVATTPPDPARTVGSFFPDRLGVGKLNDLAQPKDVYVYSNAAFRPRIYLQGDATVANSTPGIEFALDNSNTRRDAIVGAPAGGLGAQLEFYTKPDSISPVQRRIIIDASGNLIPAADNAYTLGESAVTGRWKDFFAVAKHSALNTSFGSGVTLVPVLEGPEYLLYDSGSVTLGQSGEAWVDMDPRFVEITNTGLPYRVLTSGCRVREKESGRFRVTGEAGDAVDWMVMAVRAGFENVRFRDSEGAEPVGQADPEHAVARKSPDNNRG